MFKSNEELFQATHALIASLDQRGHLLEAEVLKNGLISLNGLTDGWALLLDAVQEVESKAASVLADSEKKRSVKFTTLFIMPSIGVSANHGINSFEFAG